MVKDLSTYGVIQGKSFVTKFPSEKIDVKYIPG